MTETIAGEGLAFPSLYVDAQLFAFSDGEQRRIMPDTLEALLVPCLV